MQFFSSGPFWTGGSCLYILLKLNIKYWCQSGWYEPENMPVKCIDWIQKVPHASKKKKIMVSFEECSRIGWPNKLSLGKIVVALIMLFSVRVTKKSKCRVINPKIKYWKATFLSYPYLCQYFIFYLNIQNDNIVILYQFQLKIKYASMWKKRYDKRYSKIYQDWSLRNGINSSQIVRYHKST